MEPPIVSIKTNYILFDEHDPYAMLTLELIKERFEGVETPFQVFSREGQSRLVFPETVRGKLPSLGWKDPNEPQHSAS